MSDHFFRLRVGYKDVHLIELRVRVVHGEWSAASATYVSHSFLAETGETILQWAKAPSEPLRVEAGADTGVGHMILQFSKIDDAGHVRCAVRLAAAK